mgnify:CR=1 FL=1
MFRKNARKARRRRAPDRPARTLSGSQGRAGFFPMMAGISPWDFGYDGTWEDRASSVLGMVFTDRGIYRPGDRIFLLGYSRGAYAVRSLAGVIDGVGLLRPECATERNVQTAYRHYQ